MGIKSIGLDASPFCRFMVQAKLDGLTVPLDAVTAACRESKAVFEHFKKRAGKPDVGSKARYYTPPDFVDGALREDPCPFAYDENFGPLPTGCEAAVVYSFLLLAYLDGAGYSERSERKAPYDQFKAILERYRFAVEKIQNVLQGCEAEFADATALRGDARKMPLRDASVDGVLFSPPYSFAIDYLENDSFHLKYLGVDLERLRDEMVGLRGRTLRDKFDLYRDDMAKVLAECARVLRAGCFCTVVVGTNNHQLGKILGVPPEKVAGIEELISELGVPYGLRRVRQLQRQIRGMSNTMRTEYILFLQRA